MTILPRSAAPAGFVPIEALAFADLDGASVAVGRSSPLPVDAALRAAASSPVAGTLSASGSSAAFEPDLGRPVWLTLSGSWTGIVTLERSADGGGSWQPATLGGIELTWTARVNEPVTEDYCAGARYRLTFARSTGTLAYEVRQ